jgi:hypothetical protein
MDPTLVELTPGPTIASPAELADARRSIDAVAVALVAIPESALERPWAWQGDEADVRYGLYHALERLEAAEADARRAIAAAERRGTLLPAAPAAGRIAPATIARWDLHGLLAGLEAETLDADPGGGEWTIRQTLGHIVAGQRSYGWFTGWWLSQADADPWPDRVPEDLADRLPDEHGPEMAGSITEIRARLDTVLDDTAARLGGLDDDALGARARWSGVRVTVGFRVGRWSSHIREHTIQVEKTLALLGRAPSEPERIARRVLEAYGRLEAAVFARPAAVMAAADDRGRTVAEAFADIEALSAAATSVRSAAEAG